MSGKRLYKKHKSSYGAVHTANHTEGVVSAGAVTVKRTLVLVLGVILVSFSIFVVLKNQVKNESIQKAEEDYTALSQEALPYLDPTKYKELAAVVAKIQSISDYSSNVNLQYIVTLYSLYSNDIAAAKSNVAQLESVYDASKGLNETLQPKALSIDQIKKSIAFAENKIKEYDANAILIPDGLPQ